jgi:hypothetical protein
MPLLEIVFNSLALTSGAFLVTALLVTSSWSVFKLIDHPEWGPSLAFLVLLLAYIDGNSRSPLLILIMIFTLVACLVIWPEGAEWRTRKKTRRQLVERPAGRSTSSRRH